MTQAIQQTDKVQTLRTSLGKMQKELQVALPQGMAASRMIRVAMTTIQKNPDILDCSTRSILAAVVEACQLGLTVDGVLGHGYLVPYKPKGQPFAIAQFQIGYRGFIHLAWRSASMVVAADIVHQNDLFDFEDGTTPWLKHKKLLDGDRGKAKAIWAVARATDGQHLQVVLTVGEVEKVQNQAQSGGSRFSPWNTHWDEMAKKTAVRRLAKMLPISEELQRAAVTDEYKDAQVIDAQVVDLDGLDAATATQLKAEELKLKMAAEKEAAEKEKAARKKADAAAKKKAAKAAEAAQKEAEGKDKQDTPEEPQKPTDAKETVKEATQPAGKVSNKVTRKKRAPREAVSEADYPTSGEMFGK